MSLTKVFEQTIIVRTFRHGVLSIPTHCNDLDFHLSWKGMQDIQPLSLIC